MDFKEAQICPVCKSKLIIDFYTSNKYQRFNCDKHFKGSVANLPSNDNSTNIIYEAVILLNNNFKLDLRYSEFKNSKLYTTVTVYSNSCNNQKTINDMIPKEYIKDFDINKIYKYCQKMLENISFI